MLPFKRFFPCSYGFVVFYLMVVPVYGFTDDLKIKNIVCFDCKNDESIDRFFALDNRVSNKYFMIVSEESFNESDCSSATSHIDPQSSAFLNLISSPSRQVKGISGTSIKLWGKMQFSELPECEWDPSKDLHRIRTHWEQISGLEVKILDADGEKTEIVLPEVSTPQRLEFRLTMTNKSGTVYRMLMLELMPRLDIN